MSAKAGRFPLFDSFRAIAALSIFAYHALGFALVPGSDAVLRPYIANPKAVVPQGSMAFPGLRNEQQLNDLIAYLKAQGG